jgi:hypothetical protein
MNGTAATAVSGNNVIGDYDDAGGTEHGFLYNGSGYTTLDPPGSRCTYAYGVSDLAGQKECRMGTQADYVRGYGWEWDSTLGGRFGLFRYGSEDPVHPEGWQLDVEGAAFPRLDLMLERELRSTDFRVGVPLTYRIGPWETKLACYHLCSHAGDQFMLDFPEVGRVPYIRDAIDLGFAYCPTPNLRLYSEFGWAFNATGGAKPFDLQFGAELSNQELTGWRGMPFAAIHAHLRQENDFGGYMKSDRRPFILRTH